MINKLQVIDDVKEMMNTRQAVKSVEGYNTLSRREQDKIARESGC